MCRRYQVLAGVALLTALLTAAIVHKSGPSLAAWLQADRVERGRWNVLLVTLDTTRADHLGAYGAPFAQTPTLDRLAREGLLVERAEAVTPLTLPAHYSVMTGRLPVEHGIRDNAAASGTAGMPTLARLLRAHGYRTAAFVASAVLDARWGLNDGFDTYDGTFQPGPEPRRRDLRRDADEVTDRALPWLARAPSPFFLWLHYYDAHAPYEGGHAAANGYEGYDGAVTYTDAQLERVIAALDDNGQREHTVIVVIGDHGESLGQHGERTHGLFIYESVTHVPFIVCAPGQALRGTRTHEPAGSIDVLPTILDLLGLEPPAGLSGRSVVSPPPPPNQLLAAYSETMYPRNHFGWSELRAINDGRFKFIAAPRPELYDLEADPGEERNLYSERPALAATLGRRLTEFESRHLQSRHDSAPTPWDETRAQLAALGYVTGTASPPQRQDALPDPKDKIDLYNLITNGSRLSSPPALRIAKPQTSGAHGGLP